MKKIGIITFCNCMNYGAELQAFALQKKLNMLGVDAEVINIEKEFGVLEGSIRTVFDAIVSRYKKYGLLKGTSKTIELIKTKLAAKQAQRDNVDKLEEKHKIFDDFWNTYIRHSDTFYTLENLRNIKYLPYDTIVAGSDQIWNYMQTRYLDVFFLNFANAFGAKKVAYAASFSVEKIPSDLRPIYKPLIENMDTISVREDTGVNIVEECSEKKAIQVLDPTLLLTSSEWVEFIGNPNYIKEDKRYVVIYTLSGSKYIYNLAKKIGKQLNAEVVNIKSGYTRVKGDEGINHLYNVGPREFISVFNHAVYVITDSFHGTAFSINFNIPFTTLLNPVSKINGRALSILRMTNTMNRMIYDDGSNKEPDTLIMDYTFINSIIDNWREKSNKFILDNIL